MGKNIYDKRFGCGGHMWKCSRIAVELNGKFSS